MQKTIPGAATPLSGTLVKGPLEPASDGFARQKRIKTEFNILRDEIESLCEALRKKRNERDAAKAALSRAEFDGAPNVAEFRDDYEAACAEYKALQEQLEAKQVRLNALRDTVAGMDRMLAEAQREGRKLGDAGVEPREDVGEELDGLMAERTAIMELPVPLEDAIEQWSRKVDKWAREGTPKAYWNIQDILQSRGKYLVNKHAAFNFANRDVPNAALKNPERDVIPSADNAIALLCWLHPDRMKEHFAGELERLYARLGRDGMTHSEKQEALAKLDEKILRLQMAECAAAFEKPELRLRAGVDPRAVLGVVDV